MSRSAATQTHECISSTPLSAYHAGACGSALPAISPAASEGANGSAEPAPSRRSAGRSGSSSDLETSERSYGARPAGSAETMSANGLAPPPPPACSVGASAASVEAQYPAATPPPRHTNFAARFSSTLIVCRPTALVSAGLTLIKVENGPRVMRANGAA